MYVRDHFLAIPFFSADGLFGVSERIPEDWDGGVVGYDYNLKEFLFEKEGLIHYLGSVRTKGNR